MEKDTKKNPYERLGLSLGASWDEIHRGYTRRRAELLGRIQRQAASTTMGYRKAVSEIELQELDDAYATLKKMPRDTTQSSCRQRRATAAPEGRRNSLIKAALLLLSLLLLLLCCGGIIMFNQETLARRQTQRTKTAKLQKGIERLHTKLQAMQSEDGDVRLSRSRTALLTEVKRQKESFTATALRRQTEITTNTQSLREGVSALAESVTTLEAVARQRR